MKGKYTALAFTRVAVLLLALSSASALAQVTINPGDIIAIDPNAINGQGALIRIHPSTGVQTILSSQGLFGDPVAIALEADGNIVIADRNLPGVIRVNPLTGGQSIVHSGTPFVDPFGLALEPDGSILVTDTGCFTHSCTTGGPRGQKIIRLNAITGAATIVASGGYLDSPYAIDVEANGNILVADSTSNIAPLTQGGIIRINPLTGIQSIVSRGTSEYACPFGIALEADGKILTSVFQMFGYGCSPGALFRANPVIDQTTVVSPHSIGWQAPFGMAVDTDGTILVAEEFYRGVFRVNPSTGVPVLLSGDGFMTGPTDVAIARPPVPPAGSDLSITNSDGVTTVTAGDGITRTYTISVSNAGPSQAAGATLTDSWPGGFVQGSITSSQGSCTSGGSFTCSLGNLAPGESATVTVNYTVPAAAAAGTQTNTAAISSNTPDSNGGNNSAGDTTTIATNADLWVTKSDGVTSVTAGDGVTYTYTINVSTAGPSQATAVNLVDTWPAAFARGTITPSQGSCALDGANFTCSLGNLASGGSATVSATYTVSGTAPNQAQTNTVSVSSSTPDSNMTNNSASDTTTVITSANLSVTKSDGVTGVTAGDGITRTYTIAVTNAGPSQASSVDLTDTWPSGFVRGATTPSQGTCSFGGGNFTCSLGTLASGGSAMITVNYTVPSTTSAGTQSNSVTVTSSTPDPDSGNNTAGDSNTVLTSANLSVTKTDGVTQVSSLNGATGTYTITVSNAGPSQALTVNLTDTWPSGFVRGATTPSQGTCSSGGGNFTCSLGTLGAGGTATVTVNYAVPVTTLPGSQTNTVTVTSSTPDPNSANNTASDTNNVVLF